ncbi:hypothetical protein RIR_jg39320.t1 [Rhizophagus irregularis DAOM 181602=DAOM 197198]|nr:hypothetical protein RIR_jg39320.t1 [Rhizophagus irregularis DAOM 181602=DAOM 197198]
MAPHANIISSFDELQKVSKTTVNLLCEELSRKEARIDDDDVFSSDNYEDYEDIYQYERQHHEEIESNLRKRH